MMTAARIVRTLSTAAGAMTISLAALLGAQGIGDALADDAAAVAQAALARHIGDLRGSQGECDPDAFENPDDSQYITNVQVVPMSPKTRAVLINTMGCSGGNGVGIFFILVNGNKGRVITNTALGDMSFLGNIQSADGDTVVFSVARWLQDDPHCCPSQQGTLTYNIRSGKQTFDTKPMP